MSTNQPVVVVDAEVTAVDRSRVVLTATSRCASHSDRKAVGVVVVDVGVGPDGVPKNRNVWTVCRECLKPETWTSKGWKRFAVVTAPDPAVTAATEVCVTESTRQLDWLTGSEGAIRRLARETATPVHWEVAQEPGVPLAGWRWNGNAHQVILNPDYTKAVDVAKGDAVEFGKALLRHESAHGLYTTREFGKLETAITDAGIDPSLWNLLEDVRIEAKARDMDGTPFGWDKHMSAPAETKDPSVLLSAMLNSESDTPSTRWAGKPEDAKAVAAIYKRLSDTGYNALDSFGVVGVAKEWLARFKQGAASPQIKRQQGGDGKSLPGAQPGQPGGPPKPGQGKGGKPGQNGQPGTDKDGQPNPNGQVDKDGNHKPGDKSGYGFGEPGKNAPPPPSVQEAKATAEKLDKGARTLTVDQNKSLGWFGYENGGKPLSKCNQSRVKMEAVRPMAAKLSNMITAYNPAGKRTSTSGSRVHLRNAVSGQPDAFVSVSGKSRGRKVFAMFDMSGSMSGDWYNHGAAFLAALCQLHRQGLIDLTAVLTGGKKSAVVPPTISQADITRLYANHSCESVDASLKRHQEAIVAADTVLIYTDGNLTDGDVRAGEWRGKGVDLIGVAVKQDDYRAGFVGVMREHFARVIVEPTGMGLATRIVQYVLTGR